RHWQDLRRRAGRDHRPRVAGGTPELLDHHDPTARVRHGHDLPLFGTALEFSRNGVFNRNDDAIFAEAPEGHRPGHMVSLPERPATPFILTERGGANLEHRYTLNCVQRRPTGLIRTAVTGGFSVSAGRRTVRTSLGVKRSQVQ